MFYSQSLLSRKGPLGTIWIAAYCFRKLKKVQIVETDISSSIDKIMPDGQISYRILAQLLLGVVKIFSKQVDFLYHDCSEALTNVRKSFIPIQLKVPKEAIRAQHHNVSVRKAVHASNHKAIAPEEAILATPMEAMCAQYRHVTITLPTNFELDSFDLEVPEEGDTAMPHEQSRREDAWHDERDQASLKNESCHRERGAHDEFNSACFTPVDDVISSHMMDIHFEMSEFYNSSSLEVGGEKLQGDLGHLEGLGEYEMYSGDRVLEPRCIQSPKIPAKEQEHQVEPVNLLETIPSDLEERTHVEAPKYQAELIESHETRSLDLGKPHVLVERYSEATTPAKTHDKPNFSCGTGFVLPEFTVTTPAKREQPRKSRKRKKFFDEAIVLSNETLRQGLHDASDLVCKRRKAPHTVLDAWKADIVSNLQQKFMEPLIPCITLELKALFQKKYSGHLPPKKSGDTRDESGNVQKEVLNEFSDEDPFQGRPSVDTPPPASFAQVPEANNLNEVRTNEPSFVETSDSGLEMMDWELNCHEEARRDQDGWSIRTRAVAQYLYSRFQDLKKREQKEILSLARILEGKTRAKCASFFYETLTLKSRGCIDVKQDSPYDNIILSATPRMEALFNKW